MASQAEKMGMTCRHRSPLYNGWLDKYAEQTKPL